MDYDLDYCIDRRGTCCYKWDHYDQDVLPLPVADMDFPSPEPIVRALHDRVAHGIFGYTDAPDELYEVIQSRLERLYGWQVARDEILFLPGVVVGLNVACRAIGEPGDGVLIQPPVYSPFFHAPGYAGHTLQQAPLRYRDGYYEIDLDAFEAAITPCTRLFVLCNPHNPVGRVFRRDELLALAQICQRHDVIICADEIHCDLIWSGYHHLPIAALDPEIARRTITLMAPSKTYNIAGLKCSFAVIQDRALREQFRAAQVGLVGGVNLLGYTAALAAYRDGQPWLDQVLAYVEANRDWLGCYLAEHVPQIKMTPLEGTYLAWLDCRQAGIAGLPGEFFLQQARVALNEGTGFGAGGEGFVRLNLGCPRATLVEALERMRAALVCGSA